MVVHTEVLPLGLNKKYVAKVFGANDFVKISFQLNYTKIIDNAIGDKIEKEKQRIWSSSRFTTTITPKKSSTITWKCPVERFVTN